MADRHLVHTVFEAEHDAHALARLFLSDRIRRAYDRYLIEAGGVNYMLGFDACQLSPEDFTQAKMLDENFLTEAAEAFLFWMMH